MEEKDFIIKYQQEEHIYKSWGQYVKERIVNLLQWRLTESVDNFLKVPVNVRIKSVDSLLAKAYQRPDKQYKDPYNEITDKVGIRFVVLFLDDVRFIGDLVESIDDWCYSKDKDFDDEREKSPDKFGYESLHYVVTNKRELKYNEIEIPTGICCEIQIRTLLQHAYCEMSHNTIYKKNVHSKVKRMTARSMALIESADVFFKEVKEIMLNEEKLYINLLPNLIEYYKTFAELTLEDKTNMLIIDSYSPLLNESTFNDVKSFIESKPFLKDKIIKNYNIKFIYRQPVVILLYYLISRRRSKVAELWPLTRDELIPLYNDLGISLDL